LVALLPWWMPMKQPLDMRWTSSFYRYQLRT